MLSNESSLHMRSVPLGDWLVNNEDESIAVWGHNWSELLHRGEKEELETYLSSFCFSILDLSEKDQVFVARTVFVSMITYLLRFQSKKDMLQPKILTESYKKIFEIDSWQNISEFILNISSFTTFIVDDLLDRTPLYDDCPRLNKAIKLVNTHLTNRKLTVGWLAKQVGISTTHLSNLFRLKMGMNASEYIAKRKVSEIAHEIVHSTKSLATIRKNYGFANHSHFIQFFKRHKGKTPLKYRQYVLNMTGEKDL